MTFSSCFEKKMNEHMHDDGQPERAPSEFEDTDMAMKKKGLSSPQFDDEFNEKRRSQPPRFSTIFGTGSTPSPPPPPPLPRQHIQEYYPEARKKSGVHLSMPVFIFFVAILFFSWTIIFAYTIIGLYNNAPARLFPWAGQGAARMAAACDCNTVPPQTQPNINIAPNFVVPHQANSSPQMITITASPITVTATPSTVTATPSTITITPSTSSTTTSSSTTSSSTASSSTNNPAPAIASEIAAILGSISKTTSESIAIVTASATRSTVTSVKLITQDASGNVISATPAPTVTLTTVVDPPAASGSGGGSGAGTSAATKTTMEPIVIVPTTIS